MQRDETGRFIRGQSQLRRQSSRPASRAQQFQAPNSRGSRSGGRGVGAKTTLGLLAGAGIGAGLMYLFDPYEGAHRRQQLADRAAGAMESTGDALGSAWESVSQRAADAGSTLAEHLPDTSDLTQRGRRWLHRASDSAQQTASGWLDSARSSLPSLPQRRRPTDISVTTAGVGAAGLLALGLGAMWLLDPGRGRGRRAWIGQKATRLLHETGDFMRATGRHLANKSKGYYYETRSAAECAMSSITGESAEQPDPSTANLSA